MTINKTEHGCDYCGQKIKGQHMATTDIQISSTYYDGNGDITSTHERVPDGLLEDYIIICTDCTDEVVQAWNTLVQSIVTRRNQL
jgi:hypothetical protein